jgi:hypothetical protein
LTKRAGIFNDAPEAMLHFGTSTNPVNLIVEGDLTVKGNATYIDVSTLRVEDFQLELGVSQDGTTLPDAQLDGAGIIVRSTDNDKEIVFDNANNAWYLNQNLRLPGTGKVILDTLDLLTRTRLASTVTFAEGLTDIGVLSQLRVAGTEANPTLLFAEASGNGRIQTPATLDIVANDIDVNSVLVKNVADPVSSTDASNKQYVDAAITTTPVFLTLDITGLGTGTPLNDNIKAIIEDILPAASKAENTYARVHTVSYSAVGAVDNSAILNKTFIAVDKAGTENQSVLQDVSANDTTSTISLTVTRGLKQFVQTGGAWVFDQDLVSSV